MGITMESMKDKKDGMAARYLINFIGALVMAYILAHIVKFAGAMDLWGGLQVGLWIWLGFIATVALGSILWEGKSVRLYLINVLYYLVQLSAMGAILAVWQVWE